MGLVRASGGEEDAHLHHELRFAAYEAPQSRAAQAAAQPVLAPAAHPAGAGEAAGLLKRALQGLPACCWAA